VSKLMATGWMRLASAWNRACGRGAGRVSLIRRLSVVPPSPPAPRPALAEAGPQPGQGHEGQHPPQMVRQDGHAPRCAPLGHATPPDRALRPAPFPRAQGRRDARLARCHALGAGVDARCPRLAPRLVPPARAPPAPLMARARGLERTGAPRRGRLVTEVTPQRDGGDTTAAPRTGWPARRGRGGLLRASVGAEAPQRLLGRGDRARARGRQAHVQARRPVLSRGGAHSGHDLERAAEDRRRCNRPGAAPGPGRRLRRDLARDAQVVGRSHRRLDVLAHRRAAASAPLHRTTVRGRQRELGVTTALPRRLPVLVASPPLGRPGAAATTGRTPSASRSRSATHAAMQRTGGSAARSSSSRGGHALASWRCAPWLWLIGGIHSAIETRTMPALYYGRPLRFYTVWCVVRLCRWGCD
jgi:hypothetical protein